MEGRHGIEWGNPYADESPWGWRDRVKSFEHVAAFGAHEGGVNLAGAGEAERIDALEVSANFFQTLDASAVAGRLFEPEQERPEHWAVAVISSRLWQRRFDRAPDAIGKTIQINGKSFTIIGVAPPELQYPTKLDVWIPLSFVKTPDYFVFNSTSAETRVFARLKSGVTLAEAQAEMKAYSERVKLNRPIGVEPLFEKLAGEVRQILALLMAAVGFVLLIACANVANLLLARSATRRKELAVRAALGAGRGRLLRQSLTESLLIGVLGGLAGLLLAVWLQRLLFALSPPEIPRLDEITLDYRVLAFNAALALLTGALIGLLPAIQGSKVDLIESLNETMARRVFPDGSALGKKMKLNADHPQVPREIIGVVGAVRTFGLEDQPGKEIFLPYLQGDMPPTTLAIRTLGDPMAVASAEREAIRGLDESLPPYDIKTLEQRVSDSVAPRRFLVSLMSLFALLALALAATGIYGALSYLVAQRTREIGIRMALGATAGVVLNLILRQGAVLILVGTTIGLAGAFALTRLIKTLLFDVSATEPLVFVGAAILLILTALLASFIPSRRATKVDPLVALRHE